MITLKQLQKALFESIQDLKSIEKQIKNSVSKLEKNVVRRGVRVKTKTKTEFEKRDHEEYEFSNYDYEIDITEKNTKPNEFIIKNIENFIKEIKQIGLAQVEFYHINISDEDSPTYIYVIKIWISEPENGYISASRDKRKK